MSCPFCPPRLSNENIVLESELSLYLQQPQKVLIGSGIIIPKAHRENTFDITPEEWADSYHLLHQVKTLIDKEYHPQGYNIGWNCGKTGGQEVFHVHMHIIPRFDNEPYAGRGIRYWLKQDANKRSDI